MSIILSADKDFSMYAPTFLPHLMSAIENPDFNTRKMALDVINTLASILPNVLKTYKVDLLETLSELRFDKMKPVRDATLEAL